jgi:pimeloyl-ACP methyl ester carboxylesterase
MKNRLNQIKVCVDLREKLLVIQGEKDQSTPLQSMKDLLPKENLLYVIPGIGHMSYIESPELVTQKLEMFFSE